MLYNLVCRQACVTCLNNGNLDELSDNGCRWIIRCFCFLSIFFLSLLLCTWMTLMLRPVSRDSCSLMCLVGFGVAANAAFRVSSCLAFMVVRGPRRFPTALCSSFSLLQTSLSDKCPVSESFPSSCGSWESGDKLGSLHVVTVVRMRCCVLAQDE